MNYYPFHIGDYRSHTAHLTRMQDLAYRRLLDLYYMHERSLPADPVQCARRIGMSDCLDDVRVVLEDFFVLDEIGHHNKRCDEILHEFTSRREKAQRAGIASGAARRAKAQQEESHESAARSAAKQALPPGSAHADHLLTPGSTDVERTLNERSTDAEHPFNECSRGVQPTNNQNQNQREKPLPPLPPLAGGDADPPGARDRDPWAEEVALPADGGLGAGPPADAGGLACVSLPVAAASPVDTAPPGEADRAGEPVPRPSRRGGRAARPQDWSGVQIPRPPDVPDALWRDFCALRRAKGAPVTETAFAGIRREAGRAGADLAEALGFMVERGHQGFIAEAWRRAHESPPGAGRRVPAPENLAAISYGPGGPL